MLTKPLNAHLFISFIISTILLLVLVLVFWLVIMTLLFRGLNAPPPATESRIPALDTKAINAIFPGTFEEKKKP